MLEVHLNICPAVFFLPLFPEMSKHYNQKASLEQELPSVTQKLCTTTECLLGSLGSLTSSTGKVWPTGVRQQPCLYFLHHMFKWCVLLVSCSA